MESIGEVEWRAEWIWGYNSVMDGVNEAATQKSNGSAVETDVPRYYYFRKTFALAGELEKAVLRACADSRYRLWLNGRLVGHGPARSDPTYQYYDVYDVKRI